MKGLEHVAIAALALACSAGGRPNCPTTVDVDEAQSSPGPVHAEQPASKSVPNSTCGAGQTTLAVESCVGQELEALEADLKKTLEDLEQKLHGRESLDAESGLRSSQAAWEKFRDSHCGLPALIAGGGSLSGVDATFCRRDLTAQRLEQIRALLQGIVE
jgi:uncharacterized protein YecT (DUF1311 family)